MFDGGQSARPERSQCVRPTCPRVFQAALQYRAEHGGIAGYLPAGRGYDCKLRYRIGRHKRLSDAGPCAYYVSEG